MSYSISYYPQAEDALSSLDSEERSRVMASILRGAESGPSNSNVSRLQGIPSKDPAYVLGAGNNLKVFLTIGENRITVMDVLNRFFVERYG